MIGICSGYNFSNFTFKKKRGREIIEGLILMVVEGRRQKRGKKKGEKKGERGLKKRESRRRLTTYPILTQQKRYRVLSIMQ